MLVPILSQALFTHTLYVPQTPLDCVWRIRVHPSHKSQCFRLMIGRKKRLSQKINQLIMKYTSEKALDGLISAEVFSSNWQRTLEEKIRSRGLEV